MPKEQTSALLIIDVQNDFCRGGALAVSDGDAVVGVINRIAPLFRVAVATQDWHPADHCSFASQHTSKKPLDTIKRDGILQVLWPDHCVQGTSGAALHAGLNTGPVDLIIRKGANPKLDSYSGFFENDRTTATGLDYYLKGMGLIDLYICGLATDYCVYYTTGDAIRLGYHTHVVVDGCRGVDFPEGNVDSALADLEKAGGRLITSDHIT